jgi:hypothetical protein
MGSFRRNIYGGSFSPPVAGGAGVPACGHPDSLESFSRLSGRCRPPAAVPFRLVGQPVPVAVVSVCFGLVCPPRHGQIKTRSPLHPTASSSSHSIRTCLHYTTIAIRCIEEISPSDSPPVTPGSVVVAGFSLRLRLPPYCRAPAPISRSGQGPASRRSRPIPQSAATRHSFMLSPHFHQMSNQNWLNKRNRNKYGS